MSLSGLSDRMWVPATERCRCEPAGHEGQRPAAPRHQPGTHWVRHAFKKTEESRYSSSVPPSAYWTWMWFNWSAGMNVNVFLCNTNGNYSQTTFFFTWHNFFHSQHSVSVNIIYNYLWATALNDVYSIHAAKVIHSKYSPDQKGDVITTNIPTIMISVSGNLNIS